VETRSTYTILIGNLHGKQTFGRPRRWENNIKIDLREMGCEDMRWMELPPDSVQYWT
jgi:hypothetical protein